MDETERLSALIGDIYDAALDPTLWVDVLGKTKGFIGGQAASLGWKDAVTKRGGVYHDDDGISPHYRMGQERHRSNMPSTRRPSPRNDRSQSGKVHILYFRSTRCMLPKAGAGGKAAQDDDDQRGSIGEAVAL